MLDKRLPKYYCHITSLKDVKDLNIKISELNGETKIICPISMIEFSGLNTFYFFWNCGCLVSKKAYDELNMKDKCILCGEKFDKNTDLVNINYSKEERKERFESIMAEKKRNKILRDKKKSDKKNSRGRGKVQHAKLANLANLLWCRAKWTQQSGIANI